MKSFYLATFLVLISGTIVSCTNDNLVDGYKPATISLSLKSDSVSVNEAKSRANITVPSDGGNTIGTDEATLHNVCAALFDANDNLVTLHEYTYNGDEKFITTTDAKKILVVANAPTNAFLGTKNLNEFKAIAQDLGYTTSSNGLSKTNVATANSQTTTALPMSSDVISIVWSATNTWGGTSNPVILTRKVARVALASIKTTFSGGYAGCTFTPTEIFMYNANNNLSDWVNNTVSGNVSGEYSSGSVTNYLGSGTSPSAPSDTNPYFFYVYSHNTTSPTKLIVKGLFKTVSDPTGVTKYYPIIVNHLQDGSTIDGVQGTDSQIDANKIYNIKLTIAGIGVDSPGDDITPASITVQTTVSKMTDATITVSF